MSVTPYRCGRIALVGRPNVGKSTLLNALIGTSLSITAPKPQTTRHSILAVRTTSEAQLIYVDTPGMHLQNRRGLNRRINAIARAALSDVDVICQVIAAGQWRDDDQAVLDAAVHAGVPIVAAVNKVDLVHPKPKLFPFIEALSARASFAAIALISATKDQGLSGLEADFIKQLPEADAAFADDTLTDRPERFFAAEYIREQLIRQLDDELPYAATVTIEDYSEEPGITRIEATIWVERSSQKAIVIGEGGSKLKEVGARARKRIEHLVAGKVFLGLWVKVKDDWSDDDRALDQFGYS